MALYKRGNIWWVKITNSYGEVLRQSTNTEDKQAAQRKHDILKGKLMQQTQRLKTNTHTFSDAVDRWLAETSYKATHARDERVLKWFCQYLGDMKLSEISTDRIKHILHKRRGELSTSSMNCYLSIVRALLRRAEREWEWLNRAPYIKLTPVVSTRIRYLSRQEAETLLSHLPVHLRNMVKFSLLTGLRRSNVTGLRWEQVDLERGMAWIHADQSKNRKPLGIPLSEEVVDMLVRLPRSDSGYVFVYKYRMIQQTNTKAFRKALRRAGIENFRWHDLRHTWASWHIQNGTPIHVLQELGGWHSFEMVKRYAHLSPQHLKVYSNQIGFGEREVKVDGGNLSRVKE